MSTTSARQLAVHNLEAGAFSNEHAQEDILIFKQGVYEAASTAGIEMSLLLMKT